ncbi:DUF6000 family protein [Streptomyces adelaidensis]|uniref:DUF6000 family protein n=1 Tax=Streptomyces adelaidensis TaxID=2796465 RepID=UPI001904A4F2|nr:DUF6000 family protein [Streptomyces adelaidensis]
MSGTSAGDLFARYCLPGNRYKKLLSGSFIRAGREQALEFGAAMMGDGRQASASELEQLLGGDWREALTACWLIGFALRSEFREELHGLIKEGDARRTGKGVAFALARFCQPSDAYALKRYLQRSLSELQNRGNQPWCLGALLYIERRLGIRVSQDLLASEGLWDRWSVAGFLETDDPSYWEREVAAWIELAESLN